MASIVLSGLGRGIGSGLIAGGIGRSLGGLAGKMLGHSIDQALFGTPTIESSGRRLEHILVQRSSYGDIIPIIYGTVKVAGNIIWASHLRERSHNHTYKTGGKLSRVKHSHTSYSYSISLAIAICEGPILSIEKIMANEVVLNSSAYKVRIYKGDEEQLPDPLIESKIGIGKTPAYRGLAYIVFEDLDLAEFGNRLPNFTFEVKKRSNETANNSLEDKIEAVVMIPGSGEFVYDTKVQRKVMGDQVNGTWIQRGLSESVNQHNNFGIANSLLSLDTLEKTLPNAKWVAPVVGWFASSLDIKSCRIMPGVEFKKGGSTYPDEWSVAGYTRDNAYQILSNNNSINYGGSPDDGSITRYLNELKKRGFSTMLIPMFFIDTIHKPWRGRLTGNSSDIATFFNGENGYNKFILHYANLSKGLVDAFIIGSELIGLTKIKDERNRFLAVTELVGLAKKVRSILGPSVKISYAADWSEYHHTDGGWYNLDELWASEDIDFVGIDAYFPLTNGEAKNFSIKEISDGWAKGELQEFYLDNNVKMPLSPEWAVKNIDHWWHNKHYNPDGKTSAWIPKSKPIWFTELGFPSVSGASNQPNVFFDPTSIESALPKGSTGEADFAAQRRSLIASLKYWERSEVVAKKFIWTWDARPYPEWPKLNSIWADSASWYKGHWIQGKLGITTLAKVLIDLCAKAKIPIHHIDFEALDEYLDININGIMINNQQTIRSILQMLQSAYDFYILEHNDKISFLKKQNTSKALITFEELIPEHTNQGSKIMHLERAQDSALPHRVNINYIDAFANYKVKNQYVTRSDRKGNRSLNIDLSVVSSEYEALRIATNALFSMWNYRNAYSFIVPITYVDLRPGDLINLDLHGVNHSIRITEIEIIKNLAIKIHGLSEDIALINTAITSHNSIISSEFKMEQHHSTAISKTKFEILDIPLLLHETDIKTPRVLIACCGEAKEWAGCNVYCFDNATGKYIEKLSVQDSAVMGATLNKLELASPYLIDRKNTLLVNVISGDLHSISLDELLAGKNMAVIGNEIIQFQNAQLINQNQYLLSNLYRGLQGTEDQIDQHLNNDRFVLLDESVLSIPIFHEQIGQDISWKVSNHNVALNFDKPDCITKFQALNIKPLAPTNLRVTRTKNEDVISWARRTRGGAVWSDFADMPLNEEKELYKITIKYNGINVKEVIAFESNITTKECPAGEIFVNQVSATGLVSGAIAYSI